jgi:hypothetical protein
MTALARRPFGVPTGIEGRIERAGDVVLELCPRGVGVELVVTGDDAAFVGMILSAAARAVSAHAGPVSERGGRAGGRLWCAQEVAEQAFEAAQQAMRVGSSKRPILSR